MARVMFSNVYATSSPRISRIRAIVMFSSWPVSALVAGLKIEGSSFALSTRPGGSFSPVMVAWAGYFFHAVPRVFLPRRAREVTADHAFDRKHVCAPAQHGAAGEGRAMSLQRRHFFDDHIRIRAYHVMMHHAFELLEPPRADLEIG